jgi:hypothetical protein
VRPDIHKERQKLLNEYAATSRAWADAVELLGRIEDDTEAFIRALDEAGNAHRASERLRIRLDRHLAQTVTSEPSDRVNGEATKKSKCE